jgi:hypothetical protein
VMKHGEIGVHEALKGELCGLVQTQVWAIVPQEAVALAAGSGRPIFLLGVRPHKCGI